MSDSYDDYECKIQLAEHAWEQALEEKQEPVAWISDSPTKGNGKQLHWTKSEAWRWSSNITPLYTAPPKHEKEPVAWANSFDLKNFDMKVRTGPDLHHTVPLYTAPPKREWVGLTDEEMDELVNRFARYGLAREIEAKLREKNGG